MLSIEHLADYAQPEWLHARWRRQGLEDQAVVGEQLIGRLAQFPGFPAIVDGEHRLTNGQVRDRANAVAAALVGAGVRPGDVVSWQLPNWWEAAVLALATWQVGAVNNPIVMIYRAHELRQILSDMRPRVVVTTATFRGTDHASLLDGVLADLGHVPDLRLLARGPELPGWDDLSSIALAPAPEVAPAPVGPEHPCVVAYTSGTTAAAKGVVVDSRALLAETRQMRDAWGISYEDVGYMPATFAHLTGLIVGFTVPVTAGASVVLQDVWKPATGVELIARERCTFSSGSATFLEGLVTEYERIAGRSSLRQYSCGGAAVTRSLIERAQAVGIGAFRCYGSTEHMSTTIANADLPLDVRADTDGPLAPGAEISCVGPDGAVLAPGVPGEMRVRGPERMLGYVDPRHCRDALDDHGWFRTGDTGFVDAEGNVHMTGRLKDIINRGGEKFSAREIEEAIAAHPAVASAAVVPRPDGRYGEVPVAFIVAAPGVAPPAAEELGSFLTERGLARPKVPVAWRTIADMPLTAFGKVHKPSLVAMLDDETS